MHKGNESICVSLFLSFLPILKIPCMKKGPKGNFGLRYKVFLLFRIRCFLLLSPNISHKQFHVFCNGYVARYGGAPPLRQRN